MARQKLGLRADGKPDRRFYFTYFKHGFPLYEVIVGEDSLQAARRVFKTEFPHVKVVEDGLLTHAKSLALQELEGSTTAAIKAHMLALLNEVARLGTVLPSVAQFSVILGDLERLRKTVERYVI